MQALYSSHTGIILYDTGPSNPNHLYTANKVPTLCMIARMSE